MANQKIGEELSDQEIRIGNKSKNKNVDRLNNLSIDGHDQD